MKQAIALSSSRQYKEAIDTFSRAIVVDPSNITACYGRGAVYGYPIYATNAHVYMIN